jgi:multicomponent Na+:H+ antiporter subunit E
MQMCASLPPISTRLERTVCDERGKSVPDARRMKSGNEVVSKEKGLLIPFLTLLLFWILLNGSVATGTLLVGVVAAFLITFFFRRGLACFAELRLTPRALMATVQFVIYFLKEMVKSNFKLAAIVLNPALPINPGIVKVRTKLKSPMARLLLANSITLTPGTLTLELEGEWLYVHWVTVESVDIEVATESIVAGFERYLEVMYG